MKKIFTLTMLLCLALCANAQTGLWADQTDLTEPATISGGDFDGWYNVTTAEELAWIMVDANAATADYTKSFVLANDIDLGAHYWTPICVNSAKVTDKPRFNGSINGQGHKIQNLYIKASLMPNAYAVGFINYTGSKTASVKNLTLEGGQIDIDAEISGNAGSLIGACNEMSIIENCHSNVAMNVSATTKNNYVGGLVGLVKFVNFANCSYSGTMTITSITKGWGGVLATFNSTTKNRAASMTGCHFDGIINNTAKAGTNGGGGLIALSALTGDGDENTVTNCYSTGSVSSTKDASNVFINKITSKTFTCTNDVTIPESGLATICLPYNFTAPSGVTVYKGTIGDGFVALTEVTGTMPANVGFVVAGEAGAKTFTYSADDATEIIDNDLKGTATGLELDGTNQYVLKDGKFHKANAGHLPYHKAYITVESSAKESLDVTFGNPTGISEVSDFKIQDSGAIYNLNGVRVNSEYKGVAISNGKKYINK